MKEFEKSIQLEILKKAIDEAEYTIAEKQNAVNAWKGRLERLTKEFKELLKWMEE